jgi:CheY-like chemotaxis protein
VDTSAPILYVEDDPFSRQVMQLLLERALKFEHVSLFENSDRFLERLDALPRQPNLIFLDIHMQPHDGLTLLAMLRQRDEYRETRIVALTASVMNEEVDQLRRAGFDAVLAKPIDQATFPNFLQRIFDGERIWSI